MDLPVGHSLADMTESRLVPILKQHGFDGGEGFIPEIARQFRWPVTGWGRVVKEADVDSVLSKAKERGFRSITLHVGTGFETFQEGKQILSRIIAVSGELDFPAFVETHRATLTQDMFRTLEFLDALPSLNLTADFSHWYTGQEMVYGGFEEKLKRLAPVFDRVEYVHARVSDPGRIQAPVRELENQTYVRHFLLLWEKCLASFHRRHTDGRRLPFSVEILGPAHFYAPAIRYPNGRIMETLDRWEEALAIKELVLELDRKKITEPNLQTL